MAGDHRQERGLANARSGEDAKPLSLAGGQEPVEGPDAGRDWSGDPGPAQWVRCRAGDDPIFGPQRTLAVQRPTETVEHPAQDGGTDRDAELLLAKADGGARPHTRQVTERNERDQPVLEPDDLGADHALRLQVYPADRSELEDQAGRLDRRPDHAHDLAGGLEQRRCLRCLDQVAQQGRNAVIGCQMTPPAPPDEQRVAATMIRARHATSSSTVPRARLGMARSRAMPISSS